MKGCLKEPRVLVIGDVMLDRAKRGNIKGIAAEAPLVVIEKELETASPGGAGNVALNVAALGGKVFLAGLVGDDEAGRQLLNLFGHPSMVAIELRSAAGPTTVKERVYVDRWLLARMDIDRKQSFDEGVIRTIDRAFAYFKPEVVVASDYGKGVITPTTFKYLAQIAYDAGVPLIVDPKSSDFSLYRGAYLIKPNLREAFQALGLPMPKEHVVDRATECAAQLLQNYAFKHVIITMGAHGMVVANDNGSVFHQDAYHPSQVFDVMGAGDTVAAALAVAIGSKMQLVDAMAVAAVAAGIAVSRPGTTVVTHQEVDACLKVEGPCEHKVLTSLGELVTWAKRQKTDGKRIAMANGCFDLLHVGHHQLLRVARRQADCLVVAINSDESIRGLKGEGRPIVDAKQRALMLADLEHVDAVYIFDGDDPRRVITMIEPDVLVKGAQYLDSVIPGEELLNAWGGKLWLAPMLPGFSTTDLVKKLRLPPPPCKTAHCTASITIDGKPQELNHRFSMYWYHDKDLGADIPTLFREGKRVVQEWHLELTADIPADKHGGNANTT